MEEYMIEFIMQGKEGYICLKDNALVLCDDITSAYRFNSDTTDSDIVKLFKKYNFKYDLNSFVKILILI